MLKATEGTPGSHFQSMFQDFKSEVHWNLDIFVTLETRVFFVGTTKAFTNKISPNVKYKFFFIKSSRFLKD